MIIVDKFKEFKSYFQENFKRLEKIIRDKDGIETSKKNESVEELYQKAIQGGKKATLTDMGLNEEQFFTKAQLAGFKWKYEFNGACINNEKGTIEIDLEIIKYYRIEGWDFDKNEPIIRSNTKSDDIEEIEVYGFKQNAK